MEKIDNQQYTKNKTQNKLSKINLTSNGGDHMCSERLDKSCSTRDTRRVPRVNTNRFIW